MSDQYISLPIVRVRLPQCRGYHLRSHYYIAGVIVPNQSIYGQYDALDHHTGHPYQTSWVIRVWRGTDYHPYQDGSIASHRCVSASCAQGEPEALFTQVNATCILLRVQDTSSDAYNRGHPGSSQGYISQHTPSYESRPGELLR